MYVAGYQQITIITTACFGTYSYILHHNDSYVGLLDAQNHQNVKTTYLFYKKFHYTAIAIQLGIIFHCQCFEQLTIMTCTSSLLLMVMIYVGMGSRDALGAGVSHPLQEYDSFPCKCVMMIIMVFLVLIYVAPPAIKIFLHFCVI